MNKKGVYFLLIGAVVGLLILLAPQINLLLTSYVSKVHLTFSNMERKIEDILSLYFRQVETIQNLQKKNRDLEKALCRCRNDAFRFKALSSTLGIGQKNTDLIPAFAAGYVKLGNFQQLWLEPFSGYDPSRNYGVIRSEMAIGIVVAKERRPLMILAGDKECNFAVYIGDKRAPGIATGLDARHMIVKYIPEWMPLNIGDKVLTSGLDHIFPAGIPVGRVLSVRKMQGFKNARIELFGDTLHPEFVWLSAP